MPYDNPAVKARMQQQQQNRNSGGGYRPPASQGSGGMSQLGNNLNQTGQMTGNTGMRNPNAPTTMKAGVVAPGSPQWGQSQASGGGQPGNAMTGGGSPQQSWQGSSGQYAQQFGGLPPSITQQAMGALSPRMGALQQAASAIPSGSVARPPVPYNPTAGASMPGTSFGNPAGGGQSSYSPGGYSMSGAMDPRAMAQLAKGFDRLGEGNLNWGPNQQGGGGGGLLSQAGSGIGSPFKKPEWAR